MIIFYIITLFPEMFKGPLTESIIKRAQEDDKIKIELIQLRDFALDKHKTVDDTPCGGGAGMVLKVDVMERAINHANSQIAKNKKQISSRPEADQHMADKSQKTKIILLTPSGELFNQKKAIKLSEYDNIILIAGHYEGFDQRIHNLLVDEEISIGEYVLTGGELPAAVLVDTISRMVPGVIKKESMLNESFMPKNSYSDPKKLQATSYKLAKDFPVYTRPIDFKGNKVPEVLQSGNHGEIKKWRLNNTDKHTA